MDRVHPPVNGNGSSTINGRGIGRRGLTHYELVELAADAVSGTHPVVPSIQQAPFIFAGVSRAEISTELKRREAYRKEGEAWNALLNFIDAWNAASPSWRTEAVTHLGVTTVWDAIAEATE
jgi:hypothetical protein